jgi:hypothetical protein
MAKCPQQVAVACKIYLRAVNLAADFRKDLRSNRKPLQRKKRKINGILWLFSIEKALPFQLNGTIIVLLARGSGCLVPGFYFFKASMPDLNLIRPHADLLRK